MYYKSFKGSHNHFTFLGSFFDHLKLFYECRNMTNTCTAKNSVLAREIFSLVQSTSVMRK